MKNSTTTLPVTLLVLVLIVASMNPAYAQTWRSQLYPEDWQPLDRGGSKDAQGRFLHDFSYAGYAKGEQDIPNSVGSVTIDVTQPPSPPITPARRMPLPVYKLPLMMQWLRGRGTVYLPSGTYKLTTGTNKFCLRIAGSNVLLKTHWQHLSLCRPAGYAAKSHFAGQSILRGRRGLLVRT